MNFSFLNLLREPSKVDLETNQELRLRLDQEILTRKPKFWEVVSCIQKKMVEQASNFNHQDAENIELGAGVLPMKINYPRITSTDVVSASHLDGILDATRLDLPDNSVQNIFLQNTFHHIPNPQDFFEESLRVLKRGGRIIIVDPYFNILSRLLYPRLFTTETFDLKGTWNDASDHAMVGANQALSYVVFRRDLTIFQEKNPQLSIQINHPLETGLRYLLTGGLNFRQLAPNFFFELLKYLERFNFLSKILGIHWLIVIEKTEY